LANGLTLWVVSRFDLPYVALSLSVRDAGTFAGLAPAERIDLTAKAIVEGGTFWHDQSVVEPPMLNGEQVRAFSEGAHSRFDLRMVSTELENGVTILGRTVRAPAFGRGNLDDVKLATLKGLQNASSSLDNGLLEMTLRAAVGEESAARLLPSNMAEVRHAELAAVERCYGELFRPETSALVAVGAVTLADLLPLAERELGGWQAKLPRPPEPHREPLRQVSNRARVHFLPQPSSALARVLMLQPAPPSRATNDELAFQLIAEIAAGSLVSRTNLALRHERGITYGVESTLMNGPDFGLMLLSASFESNEAARAVRDLQRTLENLQRAPVSAGELTSAKVALKSELERSAKSNQALARFLAAAFAEGRAADWLGTLPAAISGVTPADVQRAARSYLRPHQLEVGIAGPASLARDLEELGEVDVYQVSRADSDQTR
jgi:zinc protease